MWRQSRAAGSPKQIRVSSELHATSGHTEYWRRRDGRRLRHAGIKTWVRYNTKAIAAHWREERVKNLSASTERPTTTAKMSRYAGRRSGRDSRSKGKSNDIATSMMPRNLDTLSPRRVRNSSN